MLYISFNQKVNLKNKIFLLVYIQLINLTHDQYVINSRISHSHIGISITNYLHSSKPRLQEWRHPHFTNTTIIQNREGYHLYTKYLSYESWRIYHLGSHLALKDTLVGLPPSSNTTVKPSESEPLSPLSPKNKL